MCVCECECLCVCVCVREREREREEPLSLAHDVLTTITTTTVIEGNNVVQKNSPANLKVILRYLLLKQD